MKFSIISDVHVKNPGDAGEDILLSFLRNEDVRTSDGIFLLGDIFDLMIGPHSQYFSRFQSYFNELQILIREKRKIYYVEGNHDFHVVNLYKKFFNVHKDLNHQLFQMAPEFILEDCGKKMHFSHGDDIEIENFNYRLFKKVVTSRPLTIYANNFMPYFLITKVGETSSAASRKRNNKRYASEEDLMPIKEKYRKSVETFYKKNAFDLIVCGHSHVQDYYQSENKFEYINNGFAQKTKTYISIVDGLVGFKNLII